MNVLRFRRSPAETPLPECSKLSSTTTNLGGVNITRLRLRGDSSIDTGMEWAWSVEVQATRRFPLSGVACCAGVRDGCAVTHAAAGSRGRSTCVGCPGHGGQSLLAAGSSQVWKHPTQASDDPFDRLRRVGPREQLCPDGCLGPEQIRAYQVYLTNERRLAPSSLVVAVSALRFLYRVTLQKRWVFDDMIPAPKKPRSLPVVLSPEEVVQFLDGVKAAKHHAILTTCYAAGLRISEAVHLTVSAIDSERMVLRIAKGKGQKDRYVMLSPKLLAILRTWWKVDRPRHWLFPGERPETPITRGAVQRACQIAARRARLAKAVSPHSLRNAST